MKSQKSQQAKNQPNLRTQSSFEIQNSWEKPHCPGKNQATHICLNPNCQGLTEGNHNIPTGKIKISQATNHPFICSNTKCQVCGSSHNPQLRSMQKSANTQKAHQGCFIVDYNMLLSCIQKQKKNSQPLEQSINKIFDDFIDYLSELRQKYLNQIKYFGLSSNQKIFLISFDKRQFGQITSELGFQIVKQLPKLQKSNVLKAKEMLQTYWKEQEQKAKQIFQLFVNKIQQKQVHFGDKDSIDSNVIVSDKEKSDLIKMLQSQQKKTVNTLNLLYRASQNNFEVKKFHENCDLIDHTIVVIQTEYSKKIGGYTPLVWNKIKNLQYSKDNSGKSFVFSLTNNHKFFLQPKDQNAIFHHQDYGPTFGTGDICIHNKANINDCYSDIGKSYIHPEYHCSIQKSWTKFIGTKAERNFKVKQWEVFQVKWNQN